MMINYTNDMVRRQDHLLDKNDAIELLSTGEYGVLLMVEALCRETGGYAIPINYVWNGKQSIYFHCATVGR